MSIQATLIIVYDPVLSNMGREGVGSLESHPKSHTECVCGLGANSTREIHTRPSIGHVNGEERLEFQQSRTHSACH